MPRFCLFLLFSVLSSIACFHLTLSATMGGWGVLSVLPDCGLRILRRTRQRVCV
jgi:hypothetical protein